MIDITNLAVPAPLLSKMAHLGVSVVVNRLNHSEAISPIKAEGISLVSFDGKIKHFADYDQSSVDSGNIIESLGQHAKVVGFDTKGVVAIGVYRFVKGDTVLTCNSQFAKNELMGFAYVTPDYLAQKYGDNFTIGDGMELTMTIDEALRNLTAWQCNEIYKIKFIKDGKVILSSKNYYNADMTESLINGILHRVDFSG